MIKAIVKDGKTTLELTGTLTDILNDAGRIVVGIASAVRTKAPNVPENLLFLEIIRLAQKHSGSTREVKQFDMNEFIKQSSERQEE